MNPSLQLPEEGMTLEELGDFVANQMKRLNLVLKNLDGLNIVDIKFELQGGAYIQLNRKGFEIFDGTGRTFFVGLDGKATLTGVKVQTKDGAYPNITLDGEGDLLKASQDETNFIAIDPDLTGKPTLRFSSPVLEALISIIDNNFSMLTVGGNIAINAQSGVLSLGGSSLKMNGSFGFTGTFSAGTETVHVENGIIVDVT